MELKKSVTLGLFIGCSIFLFLIGSVSAEDYYIEKNIETIVDGKPVDGASSTLKMWVKNDRVRYFHDRDKDSILIIHMDQDKAYQLNEKTKTVKEVNLKAQFAALEKEMEVSSKKTEKTKKVGQWEAHQVILTCTAKGMSTEMEYWLTDAIKIPREVRSRMAVYLGQKKIVDELNKYSGYPVEIDARVDNKKTIVTRLVKLEEKAFDKQLFEIPKEYKTEDTTAKGALEGTSLPDGKKGNTSTQSPAGKVPGKEGTEKSSHQ
ncbi:MAG: DUF4412 domain-containing protein [bacterium]